MVLTQRRRAAEPLTLFSNVDLPASLSFRGNSTGFGLCLFVLAIRQQFVLHKTNQSV